MQLEGKKRGRPSLVDEAITNELKHYILALREAGGGGCQYPYCDCCWCWDSSAERSFCIL